MIRKLVLLLLMAIVIVGCNRDRQNEDLTVAIGSDASVQPAYDAAWKRFESENPNVKVRDIQINVSGYYQKLLSMFASGSEPDVMWMGRGLGEFASRGLLVDLTPYIEKESPEFLASLHKGALQAYTRDGKLYGLPFGVDFLLLFYNKEMFDKAGVPYPNSNWTGNDLLSAAKKLTITENGRVTRYGMMGRVRYACFGASLVSNDGREVTVDSPATAAYLTFTDDLINKYKVEPFESSVSSDDSQGAIAFEMGKVAMLCDGTWNIGRITQNKTLKWGVAVIPRMYGNDRMVWASTSGFCISKNCKNKDLAWRMLKEYVSPSFLRDYYPSTMPANLHTLAEVLKSSKMGTEGSEAVDQSLKSLYFEPRVPNISEILDAFGTSEDKVYLGTMNVQAAIRESSIKIKSMIDGEK